MSNYGCFWLAKASIVNWLIESSETLNVLNDSTSYGRKEIRNIKKEKTKIIIKRWSVEVGV